MRRVLCFGDSNTWGYCPDSGERFGFEERWPGVLQRHLGKQFLILEEGLNGRTVDFDRPEPDRQGRNGKSYFLPCVESHDPLDWVILCLGTNDFRQSYHRSAEVVAKGMADYFHIMNSDQLMNAPKEAKVLLMSPPKVLEDQGPWAPAFKGANQKIKRLSKLYQEMSEENGALFLDLASFVDPSPIDGLHFSKSFHEKIGRKVADLLLENSSD